MVRNQVVKTNKVGNQAQMHLHLKKDGGGKITQKLPDEDGRPTTATTRSERSGPTTTHKVCERGDAEDMEQSDPQKISNHGGQIQGNIVAKGIAKNKEPERGPDTETKCRDEGKDDANPRCRRRQCNGKKGKSKKRRGGGGRGRGSRAGAHGQPHSVTSGTGTKAKQQRRGGRRRDKAGTL